MGTGHAVRNRKSAGAALLPILQCVVVQQCGKPLFIADRGNRLAREFHRQFIEVAHLDFSIEYFRRFGLKLDFAVRQWTPAIAILVARIDGDEIDVAVKNVDALAAPKNNLNRVPITEDLFDIEWRRDAIGGQRRDAWGAAFPNDVLLTAAFLLVRYQEFHLRSDPFTFDVYDRAINAPPLANALLHDVVLHGDQPPGVRIRLADAAVKDAAVASHVLPPWPSLPAPLELDTEMKVCELLARGDGAVNLAGDMDDIFAIQVRDTEDTFGIDVCDQWLVSIWCGEELIPAVEIAFVEQLLPRRIGGPN